MLQPVYISHATAISSFNVSARSFNVVEGSSPFFQCIEPDYQSVIPAMQLRRMSRLLKMGIFAGIECLRAAGLNQPDGIITGTGKGSMVDTEKFVKELKQYNEEALNPTPFILSTYNAVNGAIALQTQATGYNQTFVHRGSSLELSLYDAQLHLREKESNARLLVGCFDEMTPEYQFIKGKKGYWKKDWSINLPLHVQHDSEGSVAGEGAAFFILEKLKTPKCLGLHEIQSLFNLTPDDVNDCVTSMLAPQNFDLLVLGLNGDNSDEIYYQTLLQSFSKDTPVLIFKNFCGEYETATGFGLWLLFQYLNGVELPSQAWLHNPPVMPVKRILLYNHYRGINHNFMILTNEIQ
jgi:3-oxoacyl-[acyl-carrier-protein] synthase II